jgi:thiamine biosynthesis lipoprotein
VAERVVVVRSAVVVVGLGSACAESGTPDEVPPALYEVGGRAFGSGWVVRWLGPPGAEVEGEVRARAEGVLATVDAGVSTWRDDSELSVARTTGGPTRVSPDTAASVRLALDLAERSGGAFDPTVQPLMELWGFQGPAREVAPSPEELSSALAKVGWQKVRIGKDPEGFWLDTAGTALDLSAVAPGYAADRIHDELSALGLASVYVNVGGEIRTSGPGPRGPFWRVGIDYPATEARPGQDLALVLPVVNAAVATSGNYRNTRLVDGRVVAHTMDPRTGMPAATSVASVTVVAPFAGVADGLATAMMVLGPEAGAPVLQAYPGTAAWFLLHDEPGKLRLKVLRGSRTAEADVADPRVVVDP